MTGRIRVPVLAALLATAAWGGTARACMIDVRESGFITNMGTPYMLRPYVLYFLYRERTPEIKAHVERIGKLCAEEMEVVNLVVETAALEELSDDDRKWLAAKGVDLEGLPVSIVIGGMGSLSTRPGLLDEAGVRALTSSPKKKELKALLADTGNYCVVVFVPGADAEAGAAALGQIRTAIGEHRKEMPEQAIPVLCLDRADPKEAFFLSELGMEPGKKGEPPEPAAAVVFGKGRVFLRTLDGEDVTPRSVGGCFAYLDHNASDCTEDAVFVDNDTYDLLMHWEPALENKMLQELEEAGVEVYNPWAETEFDTSGQPVERKPEPVEATPPAATPVSVYALPALGALLVLVIAVGWLFIRKRQAA